MTEDTRDKLNKDLTKIADKYKLRHCAFCGTTPEDEFYGVAVGEKVLMTDAFNIALNVGRLWQYFREATRNALDTFEKNSWIK
ncbi:MAG: hypothetical protein A4E60_03519 [Syntrophorhabdus sp. PtaB.Bin047]|nr:MAG: hypothetical protein A4E60_03519 [Syntrophorhabdus sp. PtaB.Bin047]